jgi:hypothetical protein
MIFVATKNGRTKKIPLVGAVVGSGTGDPRWIKIRIWDVYPATLGGAVRWSNNLVSSFFSWLSQENSVFALNLRRRSRRKTSFTGTGGAVCKGATPSVEEPGGRGFKLAAILS